MDEATTRAEPAPSEAGRRILAAELLAVGSELTVGETTDTNSGELARSLGAHGVTVTRIASLPDELGVVVDALRTALTRADLVVTTGGLGPTPDDLTREAVAEVCGEPVAVDPATLAWLEGLWARRGHAFPSLNIKQAWVIPSATSLPNPNGTAPGWWVDRPDGRVIVDLPGPPREMRPMWTDEVLPRLAARGVGADLVVRTLRLHGIGESQVAELLGEAILRATNPVVATYARHEAVDVRISARATPDRAASALADEAEASVTATLGSYVWARGGTTWAGALGEALARRGWTLATSERGTAGALVGLLRGLPALRRAEVHNDDPADPDAPLSAPAAGGGPGATGSDGPGAAAGDGPGEERSGSRLGAVVAEAGRIRADAGTDVGFALRAIDRGHDLRVLVGVATPDGAHGDVRLAFQRGSQGADRAAIAGAAVLLSALQDGAQGEG